MLQPGRSGPARRTPEPLFDRSAQSSRPESGPFLNSELRLRTRDSSLSVTLPATPFFIFHPLRFIHTSSWLRHQMCPQSRSVSLPPWPPRWSQLAPPHTSVVTVTFLLVPLVMSLTSLESILYNGIAVKPSPEPIAPSSRARSSFSAHSSRIQTAFSTAFVSCPLARWPPLCSHKGPCTVAGVCPALAHLGACFLSWNARLLPVSRPVTAPETVALPPISLRTLFSSQNAAPLDIIETIYFFLSY